MSGFSVTLDDRQVKAALHALRQDLMDLKPAMAGIGQVLVTETDLAFRAQKDPWGQAWARLSAVTLRRRRKGPRKGSDKILRDTGRLANSINYRADKTSVSVGSNVIYAAVHQFGAERGAFGRTRRGAPIPWGKIPSRPFLPVRNNRVDLPPDTLEDILDVVRVHLRGGK